MSKDDKQIYSAKDEKQYYNKYLKYKTKYLDIKQKGGWFFKNKKDNPIDQWNNNLLDSYVKLKDEVGKEPDYIVNQPHGVVVFNNPTNWILKHMMKDEYVAHCVPSKHYDFLYTTVGIFVPAKKVADVQSISGSVLLDLLKNTVTARCGGTSANYATLKTVIDVIKGNFTREEITDKYIQNIKNMSQDLDNNKKYIMDYIIKNPIGESEYHPFTFPQGCKNN